MLMNNLQEDISKKVLQEIIMNKIDNLLHKEMVSYSEFLISENISVLPDDYYKNGKKLDYGEVIKLYTK